MRCTLRAPAGARGGIQKGCVREVVGHIRPPRLRPRSPGVLWLPGRRQEAAFATEGPEPLGAPGAMSHYASLLSHELIAQVPACTPRPCPPASPSALGCPAPSPELSADKPGPTCLEAEIRTQILAGLGPLRPHRPAKGPLQRG